MSDTDRAYTKIRNVDDLIAAVDGDCNTLKNILYGLVDKTVVNTKECSGEHFKNGHRGMIGNAVITDTPLEKLADKWIRAMVSTIMDTLFYFYFRKDNAYAYDVNFIQERFRIQNIMIPNFTVFISDILKDKTGHPMKLDDIVRLVYGKDSDESYVLQCSKKAEEIMRDNGFNSEMMWNDCEDDERLKQILVNHYKYSIGIWKEIHSKKYEYENELREEEV